MKAVFENKEYDLENPDERIFYGLQKWKKFIESKAFKFKSSVSDREDYIQEASLIIINACKKFDPKRGSGEVNENWFSSYLFTWLKNGLMDFCTATQYPVCIPSGSKHLSSMKPGVTIDKNFIDLNNTMQSEVDIEDIIDTYDTMGIARKNIIEKMTYLEISKEMGISTATISRKISVVKDAIKREVSE